MNGENNEKRMTVQPHKMHVFTFHFFFYQHELHYSFSAFLGHFRHSVIYDSLHFRQSSCKETYCNCYNVHHTRKINNKILYTIHEKLVVNMKFFPKIKKIAFPFAVIFNAT